MKQQQYAHALLPMHQILQQLSVTLTATFGASFAQYPTICMPLPTLTTANIFIQNRRPAIMLSMPDEAECMSLSKNLNQNSQNRILTIPCTDFPPSQTSLLSKPSDLHCRLRTFSSIVFALCPPNSTSFPHPLFPKVFMRSG